MNEAQITTHILDLHTGKPAAGVDVELYSPASNDPIALATTDIDGRIAVWRNKYELSQGIWRLRFNVSDWLEAQKRRYFFANIELAFKVDSVDENYHVPLLLNEFGYSSYRGS